MPVNSETKIAITLYHLKGFWKVHYLPSKWNWNKHPVAILLYLSKFTMNVRSKNFYVHSQFQLFSLIFRVHSILIVMLVWNSGVMVFTTASRGHYKDLWHSDYMKYHENLTIISQINVARKTNIQEHTMTESPLLFVNKQTSICYVLETFAFFRFAVISNGLLQSSRDLVSRRRWIHELQTRTHAAIEALCAVYCVFGACPTSLPFGNQNKHLANKNFLGGGRLHLPE
jgi:hypothetical protein